MLVSKYFVWFIIYSFMGWIYESTYCTIRKHHWENRGFLHGPIVPSTESVPCLPPSFFGVSHLRYAGSQQLKDLFDLLLWQYRFGIYDFLALENFSTLTGGLQQCYLQYQWSCLPAGIHRLGLAGILVVRVIYPFVSGMTHDTNVYLMEALSLVFMFLFGMDMALTVSALTNFAKNFNRIESEINEQIASAYEKLDTKAADAIGNMIEKSEQIQESAFVRKELAEEKAAALRERLTKERLESLFLSSSAAQKSTLLSIQGFKRSKDGNELRQRMRTMIDEKRHNRQK